MDEKLAFHEALNLSVEEIHRVTGQGLSLVSDVETIMRWVNCSGKGWAVARLKDLKAIALKILSQEQISFPNYNGRKTIWKGIEIPALRVFSILVNAMMASNWKGVRAVLDFLNVYNVFMGPGDDIEEKIDNILAQPCQELDDNYKSSLKALFIKYFPLTKQRRPWVMEFHGPDIGGARYASEPRRNSSSLEALIPSLSNIPLWIWKNVPKMKEWVKNHPFFQNVSKYESLFLEGQPTPSSYWGGNLAILGESGLKTRIVFVGNPWIQGCLKPAMVILQRELLRIVLLTKRTVGCL